MSLELEERTARFGEDVIDLCRESTADKVTTTIIGQLLRSATSIGANYCEANAASSKKDFKNKIHICKKEAQETNYWLRMLSKASPESKPKVGVLQNEVQQFILIFGKIISTINNQK